MLLVPTYVAPSAIEGVGIFAAEDIAEGALIWRLDPEFDRLLTADRIAILSPVHQAFIERYGYPYPHDPEKLVLELDNGRFMNHSPAPNTRFDDPDAGYARTAIAAGEELTCNYAEFDPSFEILPGRRFISNSRAFRGGRKAGQRARQKTLGAASGTAAAPDASVHRPLSNHGEQIVRDGGESFVEGPPSV